MFNSNALMVIVSVVAGFLAALILGKIFVPMLRALKAGQSIREEGPKWHNSKSGTPTMGGIVFICASLLCALTGLPALLKTGDYSHLLVLGLAMMFGLIGFYDDFIKVKKKRNLGLTGIQKLLLQIAAAAVFLIAMHFSGNLSYELKFPFVKEALCTVPVPVYLAAAVFIIVGCVNAVNITDGIDGLASGVTTPVMLFFTLVSMLANKAGLSTFPATLTGALAGLAFALNMPLVLLFVGLIYIIETMSDILQVGYFKLTHGKRIFKMAPIHHHFEMCGWSEIKIWFVFVLTTVVMCFIAFFGVRIWF